MRFQQYIIVIGLSILLPLGGGRNCCAQNGDLYGGTTNVQCPNGPKPHFYTQKIGDRWWICDPAGNGFFMKGVAAINYNMDGAQYTLNQTKYIPGPNATNWVYNWDLQMVHRLQAWGFNTIADSSYLGVTPVYVDSNWGTSDSTIPVKMPFTLIANTTHAAFVNNNGCGAPSPIKDLINGVGSVFTGWRYDYGDYFDPNFNGCVSKVIQGYQPNFHNLVTGIHNDYLLYVTIDEGDQLGGLLGGGPDFQAPDGGPVTGHPGWITLVTAPTQTSNSMWGVSYSDTTVYTKQELSNWLVVRYSNNIASLNAAWASNYTTFGSSGGWGKGTGLLDENGTCPSKAAGQACWVGDPYTLTGETSAMQADMSAFYVHYLDQYFSIMQSQWHNPTYGAPGVMLQMILLGHNTPPRKEALTEIAKYVDLAQISAMPTTAWACTHINSVCPTVGQPPTDAQARLNFTAQYLGDRPWINWLGIDANPDSAESAHAGSGVYATQAQRGAGYQTNMANQVSAKDTATGTYHVVGFYWWGMFDQDGEGLNWGLVSVHDNPYDGKSGTILGNGPDQWGYPTGGEVANFGDFIDDVIGANNSVLSAMAP